jgi:hypothetical protein
VLIASFRDGLKVAVADSEVDCCLTLPPCVIDTSFVLQLPEAITTPPALRADQVTELSVAARGFLLNLAQIAYNECEHPVRPESDNSSEVCRF